MQELSGSIGPRPNWNLSTTDLLNEKLAEEYFNNRVEHFEEDNYTKSNDQYFIKLNEYTASVGGNQGGLSLPAAANRSRSASPSRKLSDSHSNISDSDNNSDKTD